MKFRVQTLRINPDPMTELFRKFAEPEALVLQEKMGSRVTVYEEDTGDRRELDPDAEYARLAAVHKTDGKEVPWVEHVFGKARERRIAKLAVDARPLSSKRSAAQVEVEL